MAVTTSIGRRFTQLIQHLGVSKNAFAQSLGKTATVIQHLVDERNKPGYDLLCKVFEVYPDVSKDWLLLGQGSMLLSGPAGAASVPARKPGASIQAAPLFDASSPIPEAAVVAPLAVAPAPTAPDVTSAAVVTETEAAPGSSLLPAAGAPLPTPRPAAEAPAPPAPAEVYLTAALHAQHLQHQLALAEQRNQHLLEQQRLMQQLLDFAQRSLPR